MEIRDIIAGIPMIAIGIGIILLSIVAIIAFFRLTYEFLKEIFRS